jgi:hypothetical protein
MLSGHDQQCNEIEFHLFHSEALRKISMAMEWVINIEDQKSYEYLKMKIQQFHKKTR